MVWEEKSYQDQWKIQEINAYPCKATFTRTCDYVTHAIKFCNMRCPVYTDMR